MKHQDLRKECQEIENDQKISKRIVVKILTTQREGNDQKGQREERKDRGNESDRRSSDHL